MATEFDTFMKQLMRILMQMKVRKRGYEAWGDVQRRLQESGLARRLEGYKSQEEMQKRLLEAGYSRDVTKMIIATIIQGAAGFGRPGIEAVRRIGEVGLGEVPGVPKEIPGQYEAIQDPYAALGPALGRRFKAGEFPSEPEMISVERLMGSERLQEILTETEKTRSEREAQRLREEEIKLGRAELRAEKKGKPKKQLEEDLKNWAKKEKNHRERLKSFEEEIDLMEGDPKYDAEKRLADEAGQEQLNILNQLLGELDKKKCDKIIAKLSAGKATVTGLEKNKEQFMKKENLTEAEYNYIRLNL